MSGDSLESLRAKFGLVKATSDLATSTASTAIASNPGVALLMVLRRVKGTISAAATVTLRWNTALGTIAYRRYFAGAAGAMDEEVLDKSGANAPLILVTTAGIGNNYFEIYYSIEPATGVR